MVLKQLGGVLHRGRRWLTAGTVAMDASDEGITLLRLNGNSQERHIAAFAAAPLPGNLIKNGIPQRPEAVGSFLRDFMEEEEIAAQDVALVLPQPCCHTRVLTLPHGLPATVLKEAIRTTLDGDERLPVPLNQAVIGTLPLTSSGTTTVGPGAGRRGEGSEPETMEQSVLVVLCLRQTLEHWIHTIAAAELALRQVGHASVGLLQLLDRHCHHHDSADMVAVLDLQPRDTRIILVLGGIPEYMGTLPAVPDPKLRELMQHVQEDEGESDGDEAEDFATLAGLKPLNVQSCRDVVWEFIQAAEFLRQQHHGVVISQVLLTGPGSIYPGIAEQIGRQCGWPTTLLDPCPMLRIPPPLPLGFPLGAALAPLLAMAAEATP